MGNGIPRLLLRPVKAGLSRLGLADRLPVVSVTITPTNSSSATPNVAIPSTGFTPGVMDPQISLPPSFVSDMRAFAVTAKSEIASPFQAKEVTRNSDGKIIGPPSQYILSAFNKNNSPFTWGTAGRWFAYFVLLYGVMKTGVLNSPVDLVSAADDVVDAVVHLGVSTFNGNPEWRPHYFDGFTNSVFKCDSKVVTDIPGQTCYAPGGTYYQQVVKDPDHARLWGYAEGMTPVQKDALLGALLLGGVAAFAYSNRRKFQELVQHQKSPTELSQLKDLRDASIQSIAVSAAKIGAATLGSIALTLGLSRELAHPLAMGVMLTGALAIISKEYRAPIQQIEGAKVMSGVWALFFGSLWIAGDALYRGAADSAGIYQFMPTGHSTIYGNWTEWDWKFNAPLLTASLATELILMAAIWARSSGLVYNTTDVAISWLNFRIHRKQGMAGSVRHWLQEAIPKLTPRIESTTNRELPVYMSVRPQIQAFTNDEKNAVRVGQMPEGVFSAWTGRALTLGGAAFVGYHGLVSLTELLANKSHHVVADGVLALLGLGTAAVMGDALLHDQGGRLLYGRLASFLGHQFGPRGRALYWAIYTVIATTTSTSIGITTQAMQGFENIDGYYENIAQRSFINPWVNRLIAGGRTSFRPDQPIFAFEFFAPGKYTVYNGMEFSKQTAQTPHLLYQMYARDFSLSSDPGRKAELLGEMRTLENLIRNAIRNDGYGRDDTLNNAKNALEKIEKHKRKYGIPDTSSHDGH